MWCIFKSSPVGFSHFLACDLERFWSVLTKQTDSEQTDFAFDGETTATEVRTSRKTSEFKA